MTLSCYIWKKKEKSNRTHEQKDQNRSVKFNLGDIRYVLPSNKYIFEKKLHVVVLFGWQKSVNLVWQNLKLGYR